MPSRIIGKKRKFKPKIIMDHLQRSWSMIRVQGFEDSSEMLKNYKGLKVWQKSYVSRPLIPFGITMSRTLRSTAESFTYSASGTS
jgi:hypothetical protein